MAEKWQWQKGTKSYDPYAGMTPEQKQSRKWQNGVIGVNGKIDYKNAQNLIGTNASDVLYGLWGDIRQEAGKAVPVTVKTEGLGDNATTRYFLPDGTEVFQNQSPSFLRNPSQQIGGLAYEGGNPRTGAGGQWVYRAPETVLNPRYGLRGEVTSQNAQQVREALQQIYPDKTQAELDAAAASALSKRGKNWNEVTKYTDIVRAISKEMGGLDPSIDKMFKETIDPKLNEYIDKVTEARNKSDDADSGLAGFFNGMGPLASIAAVAFPPMAPYIAAAQAAAYASQGDWKKAFTSALTTVGAGQLGTKIGDLGAASQAGGSMLTGGSEVANLPASQVSALEGIGTEGMLSGANQATNLNLVDTLANNAVATGGAGVIPGATASGSLFGTAGMSSVTAADLATTALSTGADVATLAASAGLPAAAVAAAAQVISTGGTAAAANAAADAVAGGVTSGGAVSNIPAAATSMAPTGGGLWDSITSGVKNFASNPSNLNNLLNAGIGLAGGYLNQNAYQDAIDKQIAAQKEARANSEAYAAKIDATQQERLKLQNQAAQVANSGMSDAQKQLYLSQIDAQQNKLLSDVGLNQMAAQYDAAAREKQAQTLQAAGERIGGSMKFTPYGVSNNFGSSDTSGNTTLAPKFQGQFDTLFGQSQQALQNAGQAYGLTQPMSGAAQSMFQLGQGYLASTPQEQAQKYMQDQLALLDTSRQRELAATEAKLASRGRLGLSMGATGLMGAANPELEALYNARRQQDLALAAQATQGGQQYAQFGANMVGQGGKTLQDMYATQSAAYNPYNAAMGGMQTLQSEVQKNAAFGAELGDKSAQAAARAGQIEAQMAQAAAQAQYAAEMQAARYDAYANAQKAAIAGQTPYLQTQAGAQAGANAAERGYGMASSQTNMLAQAAANIPTAALNQQPYATPAPNSVPGNMLTGIANQNYNWFGK